MKQAVATLVILVAGSLGCAPQPACESGDAAELVMGGGLEEFVPFEGAPTLDLVYGPQGGVHVEVSLLATGLDAGEPWRTEVQGFQSGVAVGASLETLPQPTCRDDGNGAEVTGLRLIFEDWVRPGDFDEPIEIVAEATDGNQRVAQARESSVQVVVP